MTTFEQRWQYLVLKSVAQSMAHRLQNQQHHCVVDVDDTEMPTLVFAIEKAHGLEGTAYHARTVANL